MKKLLITLLICTILMTTLVSAATFDNTKDFKDIGDYGKYIIKDWFGLQNLQDVELKSNTEVCSGNNCNAIKEIVMHQDGVLIDEVKYIDLKTGEETSIKDSNFYILKNGKKIPYELGTEVEEGTYEVRHEGSLYNFQSVDWQIKIGGKYWTEEWATWTSNFDNDLISYYDFNEVAGDLLNVVNNSIYNGTLVNSPTQGIVTTLLPNGYDFNNGDSEYIQLNLTSNFPKINGSIMMWLQPSFPGGSSGTDYTFWRSNDDNYYFFQGADNDLKFRFGSAGLISINSSGNWSANEWVMFTATWNTVSDKYYVYVNDYLFNYSTIAGNPTSPTGLGVAGTYTVGAIPFDGNMSEMGIWNRTLNSSEISDLYNTGSGIQYGGSIELNQPEDNLNTINTSIIFNCSSAINSGILNLTLINNGVDNLTVYNTSANQLSLTLQSMRTGFSVGKHNWTCEMYDINNVLYAVDERFFNISRIIVNNQTYNYSTYETSTNNFVVNASSTGEETVTANLVYDGTIYAATKTGNNYEMEFSRSITAPASPGNKSFYWNFDYGGTSVNSTPYNQSVNPTLFGLCNATVTQPFMNLTFKDESDDSIINASITTSSFVYYLGTGTVNKTYSLTNNTDNYEYTFCALPPHRNLSVIPTVQYKKGTTYPQRVWEPGTETYSNVTTNQTLYLLGSGDGIYVTFQVLHPNDQPITAVIVPATRNIGGEDVLIGATTTSTSGAATLWVNPDFYTTVTFSKEGFTDVIYSDFLTQNSYTITFGSVTEPAADYTRGINTYIIPTQNELFNDTTYSFEFNVTSSYWDLDSFGFNLRLSNGTIVGSDSSTISGTPAKYSYDVNNQSIIHMDYYWIIEEIELTGTKYWVITSTELTDWSIKNFIVDLNLYIASGIFGLDDFGKNIIIFLILFISVGIMSYKFGITSSMSVISLIFALVFFFDIVVGLIPPIRGISHLLTYIAGVLLVGSVIREVAR